MFEGVEGFEMFQNCFKVVSELFQSGFGLFQSGFTIVSEWFEFGIID
jgi:hypothetical protein